MPTHQNTSRFPAWLRQRTAQQCVMMALALWSLGAGYAPDSFTDDEPETKKWEEIAVVLPDPPADASLLNFYVGPTARQVFFIDEKSVSVGVDGVVRYTLVSKSTTGAMNVAYEGMRCNTAEWKIYAFGREDGAWTKARSTDWRPITELVANRQHAALYKDYFCDGGITAGNARDMTKRIQYKRPMAPARDYSPNSDNR
jgi:hypothetical protein